MSNLVKKIVIVMLASTLAGLWIVTFMTIVKNLLQV